MSLKGFNIKEGGVAEHMDQWQLKRVFHKIHNDKLFRNTEMDFVLTRFCSKCPFVLQICLKYTRALNNIRICVLQALIEFTKLSHWYANSTAP